MTFEEHLTADPNWRHPAEYLDDLDDDDDDDDDVIDVAGIGAVPVNAIHVFLRLLIPEKGSGPTRWKTATARLIVLAHAVDFESVKDKSLTVLADEIGLSRAALSVMNVRLRDMGCLSWRGGKTPWARESFSKAASEVWTKRRAAMGPSATESVKGSPRQSSKQPAGTEA